jgi:hypothetical protein
VPTHLEGLDRAADRLWLDVYGCSVEIRCAVPAVLQGLASDFAFFRTEARAPGLVIEIVDRDPPYDDHAGAYATVHTPRNVSYRSGSLTIVDYFGRALGIHDPQAASFRLFSRDPDLLYEATYLYLLSQCGERLDARGLHRVHALAVSIDNHAALVLLPMGGGKSTLGWHLLRYPDVALLSDDSPLIDAAGDVLAFPLRIGLLPDSPCDVPQPRVRRIDRMEFGPKLLVDYAYLAERVRPRAAPSLLFVGRRSLDAGCTVRPASRVAAVRALFVNCVVGLGLFQGMEFVLQGGPRDVLAKTAVASHRLRASMRLLRRSQLYEVVLGRNPQENARVVVERLRLAAGSASAGPGARLPADPPRHQNRPPSTSATNLIRPSK